MPGTTRTDVTDLPATGERIEVLLDHLQSTLDEAAWARVEELVRLLTDLYGAGLVRAVALAGPDLVANLAADDLGSSLLLLHGLHPDDFEGRVRRALDAVAPGIRKGGGDVVLDALRGLDVAVVLTTASGCGSTGEALREHVASAIWEAAPDATSVDVRLVVDVPAAPIPIRLGPTRTIAVGGGS